MSFELKIHKELATLGATATEWLSIAGIVNGQIPSGDFNRVFNRMLAELCGCYALVVDNLEPFLAIRTEADFMTGYDALQAGYQSRFLQEGSKPRHFADATYEEFLNLTSMKLINTGYPLLKRTFTSLDEFIDKWVTNDAWIVMSIDVVLKQLNRFLLELAELKKQDAEAAFLVYQSATSGFTGHLDLIQRQYRLLTGMAQEPALLL